MSKTNRLNSQDKAGALTLSGFIHNNNEPILDAWEKFATNIIALPKGKKGGEARDHAQGMLTAIVAEMERAETTEQQAEKSQGRDPQDATDSQAEWHGAERE